MSTRRKRKQPITCVYCGTEAIGTAEHVIPECFFPETKRPTRAEFIIVPVCKPCNGKKARDDSYLRDMLTADAACENNPTVRELWPAVFRSTEKNWSDFGRDATRKARMEAVHSPGGVYLGHQPGVPITWKRVKRYFGFVVRGLYWHAFQERLPDDHVHAVRPLSQSDAAIFIRGAALMEGFKEITIGDGVFKVTYAKTPSGESFITGWLMQFYESVSYLVATSPQNYFDSLDIPAAVKDAMLGSR